MIRFFGSHEEYDKVDAESLATLEWDGCLGSQRDGQQYGT